MDQQKRVLRKEKREIKKAGNKSRRQSLKRDLRDRPEDAPFHEYNFGRKSSKRLNGLDQDSTRRREGEPEST